MCLILRFLPDIVEYVLLHDSGGIAVEDERIMSAIDTVDDFLDPSINRNKSGAVVGEQGNTVSDLVADAVNGF